MTDPVCPRCGEPIDAEDRQAVTWSTKRYHAGCAPKVHRMRETEHRRD